MTDPIESGILDKPTRSWPAWATALVAVILVLSQALVAVTTSSYSSAMDGLEAAVQNNSKALNQVRLTLEGSKVVDQRLGQCEKAGEDHEKRIRALEGR